jgi:hypothetical protein
MTVLEKTQQGKRQASAREISLTPTANNYNGDVRLMFEAEITIPAGATFNEAQLLWINSRLSASYTNLTEAMQAFAESQGFDDWSSMGTFAV